MTKLSERVLSMEESVTLKGSRKSEAISQSRT